MDSQQQPAQLVKRIYTSSYIKKNGEVKTYEKEYMARADGKRGRKINELVQKKKEINNLLNNIASKQHLDDIITFIKDEINTN
jgi:hypothetical protein